MFFCLNVIYTAIYKERKKKNCKDYVEVLLAQKTNTEQRYTSKYSKYQYIVMGKKMTAMIYLFKNRSVPDWRLGREMSKKQHTVILNRQHLH